jgi:UDP-N-acetylglucosamine 2-epimerase (non-hydrolysing)
MSEVAIVFGTRPEVVKLAFIVRGLGSRAWTIHTGQHWDDRLMADMLRDLGVGPPVTELGLGGGSRGAQLGAMVSALTAQFEARRPAVVVVQGDTTSALAGALAANACEVPIVHVEAGLRSYDRAMPEEHNRVLVDHLSERCCAPTTISRDRLLAEGIAETRAVVTGNTVVEAVQHLLPSPGRRREVLRQFRLRPSAFALATFHRPENVDSHRLPVILGGLAGIARAGHPVLLALHPRTRHQIDTRGLAAMTDNLQVTDPLDYPTFLALAAEAGVLVSDSGGVQEEASVLKRPIVVVRASTERPEVIGTFAVRLDPGPAVTAAALDFLAAAEEVHRELSAIPSPYGDGAASARCLEAIRAVVDGDVDR